MQMNKPTKLLYPLLLCLFWLLILWQVFKASLPIPSGSSFAVKQSFFSVLPQGWGFFTRDPREEQVLFYRLDTNGKAQLFTKTNSDKSFFFGASRRNRTASIEAGALLAAIQKTAWIPKAGGDTLLFDADSQTDTLHNAFKPSSIVGNFILVKQQRTPFAWAARYDKVVMPYHYTKIHVISH